VAISIVCTNSLGVPGNVEWTDCKDLGVKV
jgi:hypothetical protein